MHLYPFKNNVNAYLQNSHHGTTTRVASYHISYITYKATPSGSFLVKYSAIWQIWGKAYSPMHLNLSEPKRGVGVKKKIWLII